MVHINSVRFYQHAFWDVLFGKQPIFSTELDIKTQTYVP